MRGPTFQTLRSARDRMGKLASLQADVTGKQLAKRLNPRVAKCPRGGLTGGPFLLHAPFEALKMSKSGLKK